MPVESHEGCWGSRSQRANRLGRHGHLEILFKERLDKVNMALAPLSLILCEGVWGREEGQKVPAVWA